VYLPQTVDKLFIEIPVFQDGRLPPHVLFCPFFAAVRRAYAPYMVKYLRSDSPAADAGKRLPSWLAAYLLKLHPYVHDPVLRVAARNHARGALDLLGGIVQVFAKRLDTDPFLTVELRNRLAEMLYKWTEGGVVSPAIPTPVAVVLIGDTAQKRELAAKRLEMGKWNTCSHPLCTNKGDLKKCSRCHAARYCSLEHQREHWSFRKDPQKYPPHKLCCHKTAW